MGEISASEFCCVIINFYVECGGMLWLEAPDPIVPLARAYHRIKHVF